VLTPPEMDSNTILGWDICFPGTYWETVDVGHMFAAATAV
jgi:hypothetical protein